MARIAGIDLPNDKRVEIGLTYLYGIGRVTAAKVLADLKIDPSIRCKNLTDEQTGLIKNYIEKNQILIEGDLRKQKVVSIKALTDIGNYRGIRHRKHLPCRGQSTHSNARTHKGHRLSSGGSKK